jgi:glutathionylspermidine synthase
MDREMRAPRVDWVAQCESVGFSYHSIDGTYWDESRCYRFTSGEVDALEAATAELAARCLEAAEHIVAHDRMAELAIAPAWRDHVAQSWRTHAPSLQGRFDFAFDGRGPPKLLEYNADTPTALLEASVVQWHWLQQAILPDEPDADQFNSLHEKLIANWRALAVTWSANTPVHFTCAGDSEEDRGNLDYLRDVATQAGVTTKFIAVEDVGWNADRGAFVDLDEVEISVLAKLYPWEWLAAEEFGAHLLAARIRVFEPAWKMLLSNKGLLPILWELFPGHSATGFVRPARDRRRVGREAALVARRRQRRHPSRGHDDRGAGRLWRRRPRVSGVCTNSTFRRRLCDDRLVGHRRRARRHRAA